MQGEMDFGDIEANGYPKRRGSTMTATPHRVTLGDTSRRRRRPGRWSMAMRGLHRAKSLTHSV